LNFMLTYMGFTGFPNVYVFLIRIFPVSDMMKFPDESDDNPVGWLK
jgi:hypothetical protein